MRTWTPKVFELSHERVKELQCFCWQYREKRARIAARRGGCNDSSLDGMPHGQMGNPTEQRAMYAVDSKDARDVALIEEVAREAAGESGSMYECLIANVCDRVILEHMNMPSGRRQFYDMRRKFYWLLDKKR